MALHREQHAERMRAQQGAGGIGGASSSSNFGLGDLSQRASAAGAVLDPDALRRNQGLGGVVRRGAAKVQEKVRMLMKRARNPREAAIRALGEYRDVVDWSLPAGYKERLGEDYTSDVYKAGGTARMRAQQFLKDHGLEKCHPARILLSIADLQDAAICDDRVPGLINQEWYERLCRWGYALERTFEECSVESDYKDTKKSKVKWELLQYYHPSESTQETRSDAADEEVSEKMRRQALFEKYLSKLKTGN